MGVDAVLTHLLRLVIILIVGCGIHGSPSVIRLVLVSGGSPGVSPMDYGILR